MEKSRWLWPVIIVLVVAGLLLPISPLYRPVPSDDPSVYLYVGQTLLDGGAPYRDAWDHKQPLAFFLFALALILSPGSLWGIWLIELALIAAAGVLAYRLLLKVTRPGVSAAAVLLGLTGLVPILWGYSIEELALPFRIFVWFAFARFLLASNGRARAGWALSIGVTAGILFFLKQSLIAEAAAVVVFLAFGLLLKRDRRWLSGLAWISGGFVLVGGVVGLALWRQGALESYRSAAFTFNLGYAGLGLVERINAALDALEYMGSVPLLWLSIGLWITCGAIALFQAGPALSRWICKPAARPLLLVAGAGLVVLSLAAELAGSQPGFGLAQWAALITGGLLLAAGLLLNGRSRERLGRTLSTMPVLPVETGPSSLREPLFTTAALAFPLALLLMTLSGRNYVYYFITFGPFFLLAAGLVSGLLLDLFKGSGAGSGANSGARRVLVALLAGVGTALLVNPALLLVSGYRAPVHPPLPPIVQYVTTHTTPSDPILAWGKDTTYIYFLTQRRAPGRYFYQAAIWQPGYNEQVGAAQETLRAMQAQPPALFLIEGNRPPAGGPACPLDTQGGENSQGAIFAYVCERYALAEQVDTFLVFTRKP